MRLRYAFLLVVLCQAALAGCTSVTATRVKPDDYKTEGVRYWLAAPYVLVRFPTEVSRTEELFQFTAGDKKFEPLGPLAGHAPASWMPGQANSIITHASLFSVAVKNPAKPPAAAGSGALGTGSHDDPKPAAGQDPGTGKPPAAADAGPTTPSSHAPERAAPSSLADAVSVVWLPDYCEQYAVSQRSVLASLKFTVELGDGWKLGKLDTSQDSTAVVGKILDLVGTGIGAQKDIAVEKIKAGAAGSQAKQAIQARTLVRTTVRYLKPGLYPILIRNSNDCTAAPTFSLKAFQYEESVFWTEFPPQPAGAK